MSDVKEKIERLVNSVNPDIDELSELANRLKDSHEFELLDYLTDSIYQRHTDNDDIIMLRAWYLVNIECNYNKASGVLSGVKHRSDAMYVILLTTITLRTSFDAELTDSIFEDAADDDIGKYNPMVLEAARLFISEQYTDLAEKWLSRYKGIKDNEYLTVYAEILISKEEFGEAEKVYDKIIENAPMSAECWLRLSDIKISLKKYHEAIEAAEYALAIDSDNKKAENNIDMCMLCLNRHNDKKTNNTNSKKIN